MLRTISYKSSYLKSCIRQSTRENILWPRKLSSYPCPKLELPAISLDKQFYLDPNNIEAIRQNIKARNSVADIDSAHQLHAEGRDEKDVLAKLVTCPNMSHPKVAHLTEPNLVFQRDFIPPEHKIRSFDEMSKILGGAARLQNLKNLCGERSYYLTGVLANLEQALIHWAVQQLTNKGFNLISVPDILHSDIIQRCGMNVDGERTQVYKLGKEFGSAALSGTSEMAIGGFLMGKKMDKLPLKLCAVSRCFRAEASKNVQDKGLYRVHQFYKVEMFIVTDGNTDASQEALHQVLDIEREMFDSLGLAYRVLDMSPDELGDPAARKYDIEAWMPGRNFWGEISSCSDCTDYQARRLSIKDSQGNFCHTVNGTACAVPRMIIALCEQHQTSNGSIHVPEILRPFLGGVDVLQAKSKKLRPNLKYINSANFFEKENVVMD